MSIEQKAREIADKAAFPATYNAARLGIIEGRRQAFEEAAKVAEETDTGYFDERTFTAQKIATAIRALIEEQKI